MKIFFTACVALFCASSLFSQKEGNNWVFGYYSYFTPDTTKFGNWTMNFEQNVPLITKLPHFPLWTDAANTSVSDAAGNLACYSSGVNIYNREHEIMLNGDTLPNDNDWYTFFPNPQGIILLPYPQKPTRYVMLMSDIFTYIDPNLGITSAGKPLTYSYIDVSLNNGHGRVYRRKRMLLNDTLNPHLSAVRHGNGRDWWIMSSKYRLDNSSNEFFGLLLDPNGVMVHDTQYVGTHRYDGLGQTCMSPDGTQYARYSVAEPPTNVFDLYDFNRCTGTLSNHRQIILSSGTWYPGGIAFSPNSRYVYVAEWYRIWQFDTQAPDLAASKTLVAEYDGFTEPYNSINIATRFFMMALAPDNRIYICTPNQPSSYLHVIDKPDLPGTACDVQQHGLKLPFFNSFSIPNLPNYRLGAWSGSPCDTLTVSADEPGRKLLDLEVYPNPATHQATLSLPPGGLPERGTLSLFAASGSLAKVQAVPPGSETCRVSVDELPPGLYFFALSMRGRVLGRGKLVVSE